MPVLIIQRLKEFASQDGRSERTENIHRPETRHYPSGRTAASAELWMWVLFRLPFPTIFQTVALELKSRRQIYFPQNLGGIHMLQFSSSWLVTSKHERASCKYAPGWGAEGPTSKWAVNEDFFPSCGLLHTRVECCPHCAPRERGNIGLLDLDMQHPIDVLQ